MPFTAKRDPKRRPPHPGELLRETVVPALDCSKVELAGRLGLTLEHLNDILREKKPVTPTVARRLGEVLGNGAGLWTRMQAAYDAWPAK